MLSNAPATPLPSYFPLANQPDYCALIPGFLGLAECEALIAMSEARGFEPAHTDYPPSYRDNDRQVLDDTELAAALFQRIQAIAPACLEDEAGHDWSLDSINSRFRLCRYLPGQQFQLHQDGVHHRSEGLQSRLTFMIYLTDGDAFAGGDTLFYSAGPGGHADGSPARLIGRVRPKAGSLILFDHALWHSGEVVTAGTKHILRSDVLYRRTTPAWPTHNPGAFQPGHRGYVWAMQGLPGGLLASSGRDCSIRLWNHAGEAQGQLLGHQQSVLGLAYLGGGRLASVSRDRKLKLWDIASQQCVHSDIAHEAAVLSVAALPGGTLATGGADGLLKLWQAGGEAIASLAGHRSWVWDITALPGEYLVTASEDGDVRVWHSRDQRCIATLPGQTALRAVLASADGKAIITGDLHGLLTVWQQTATGWQVMQTGRAHRAAIRRLRWLAPGVLASTGEDNRVCLWQVPGLQALGEARHHNFVTDVLPLGGQHYLSCAYDGQIQPHALPVHMTEGATV